MLKNILKFARPGEPAAPEAPMNAKPPTASKPPRADKLTYGQFNAAMEAAVDCDNSVGRQLQALAAALSDDESWTPAHDAQVVRIADGELPITAEEVAEAITGLTGELAPKHLRVLKRAQAILAAGEKQRAAAAKQAATAAPQYATGADLAVELQVSAIVAAQSDLAVQRIGHRDGRLDFRLERYLNEAALRPPVRAALQRRIELLNAVYAVESELERDRAAGRSGRYQPGTRF